MVEVRRLNEKGIEAFENHIRDLSHDGGLTLPLGILTDDRTSEPLDIELTVNHRAEFATRYDMGVYLVDLLKQVRSQQLLGDSGFWTWLALCWFDQLCPLDSKGVSVHSKTFCHRGNFLPTVASHSPIRGCPHEKTPYDRTVASPG